MPGENASRHYSTTRMYSSRASARRRWRVSHSTRIRYGRGSRACASADPEEPGHDLTYQAQSGLLGDRMPRTLAADVMGAERAYAGVLALLRQPGGSMIDVGLVDSLEPLLAPLRHGLTLPTGVLGGGALRYDLYPARDGRIAVAALEPHFEKRLYEALNLPAGSDPSSRFLERSAAEWERWAREHNLPIVAVADDVR